MKLNKIKESLKELIPEQKIKILDSLQDEEKKKKEVQELLKEAKEEQRRLESSLRNIAEIVREKKQEQPLEQIVQQAQEEMPKKEQKSVKAIYGVENNVKYLPSADKEYKSSPEMRLTEVTHQERQNLINESERLEKEKKKYDTGKS